MESLIRDETPDADFLLTGPKLVLAESRFSER
jgi:hypothetical protein